MDDATREIMGLPYNTMFSYWQHYWSHCIEKLIDNDNVSFMVIGPKMLLNDLIEELEGHGLSNQDNISNYIKQIHDLDESDKAFHSLCYPIVACLLQRLGNKVNRESSILLCKKILDTLIVKHYFSLLLDWLAETIDKTPNNSFESRKIINEITHLVIAEYVAEGFLLDEIINYASAIPGVVRDVDGEVIAAPLEFETLKISDFASKKEYYKAVSDCIKNRDIYNCIGILKDYYYEPPRSAYYIVRLNGLKGQIDDYIGEINIYSPKIKRYITEESLSKIETITEDRDRVNAAVPIEFVSLNQAKVIGEAILEEVLDILMLTYRTKEPITIATNLCAVVADGKEISWRHSVRGNDPLMASKDEMMRYLDALDLSDVKGDGFKFLTEKHHVLEVERGTFKRRLKNAAHWYTKAVSADKDVDTLLYSWFAIEGLLKVDNQTQSEIVDKNPTNSLKVIQEFVVSIICIRYPFNYLRDTYRNFIYLTNQYDNYYDITEDVIIKAGLNVKEGDRYRDGDFLKAIPDLIKCVNNDIVKDELAELHMFYQNDKGLKNKADQLKNDLQMIYRLRNMIVHNAALSCVNLSFYAREAKWLSQMVIRYVIDHVSGNKTIGEIVLGAKLNYQVFLANLDKEFDLLKSIK